MRGQMPSILVAIIHNKTNQVNSSSEDKKNEAMVKRCCFLEAYIFVEYFLQMKGVKNEHK